MGTLKTSFVCTEYCVLCRALFPTYTPEGFEAWRSKVRAVLRLDPHDEDSFEITDVTSLPDSFDFVDVSLTGRLESVTICRDLPFKRKRPADRPAFCFHTWCYVVLILRVGRHPPSIIYKLAQALIPNSSQWQNMIESWYELDPRGTLQSLIAHAHSSSHEPFSMSKLPSELKTRIWEYVGLNTPYSAFFLVAESSCLIRSVNSRPAYDFTFERGCRPSAEMIKVFGTQYIQDLGYNGDHKFTSTVQGDVAGLKFAASVGGICAIQIFGVDWEMDWLGKVPPLGPVWYGMIQDAGYHIRCAYNGLNISTLGLPSANTILWDRPNIPSSLVDPDVALFDYKRDIMSSITTCKRRFFRYLPLYNNSEYIKGLTIYHNGNGIVGLEAHFAQTSLLSGCCEGCALYFPLCLNERIAYAWLRIDCSSFAWAAPALIIQTTQLRVYSFGSYIRPDLVMQNEYKWVLLRNKGCVTGLYYENSLSKIMRLGVIGDGTPPTTTPLTPQYPVCKIPPIAGPDAGLFLSVAILSDLEKVDLCCVSNRCIGMLIQYTNGPIAVLGQWRTVGVSQHSCVYKKDSSKSDTTSIYFRVTRSGKHNIVTDVSFSGDHGMVVTPDSEYRVFVTGQYIAWWFSEFDDAVLPWTGTTRDIPSKSEMSQKQAVQ